MTVYLTVHLPCPADQLCLLLRAAIAFPQLRIKHHNGDYFIQSVRNGHNLQCPPDCIVKFENGNEGAYEKWDIETHSTQWGTGFFFVSKHTGKVLQSTPSGELKCDNQNRKEYETFHILDRDGAQYSPHSPETIIRAWYGESAFSGRGVDVTRKVRKHHAKGNLRIKADNDVFGDPAFGVEKHLWIEYRSGRGPATVQAKEHEFCTLDVGETIIRAWYGEGEFSGRGSDVTQTVRKQHSEGNRRIKADNDVFGDPAFGAQKHLWIEYRSGHGPATVSALEHEFCNLDLGPAGGGGGGGGPAHGHSHGHGHGPAHGSGLEVGKKYRFEHKVSHKNVAVKPNGEVNAHGGNGDHATFTVESKRGALQFKNDKGNYLACQNGTMKSGGGGKWCDFVVREHHGHVLIRSSHGDHGVGFEENGEVRESPKVKEGDKAQFKAHAC